MDAPIESPCINVCQLNDVDFSNPNKHCLGCYRTVSEIAQWARMTPADRTKIMQALPARKLTLENTPLKIADTTNNTN